MVISAPHPVSYQYSQPVITGKYTIDTSNSFPHSSGIASSASGMSALALCICDIAVEKGLLAEDKFKEIASELARLGSGSASRSVYGPMGEWGKHSDFEGSSDAFAIPYSDVNAVFKDYCDTILLVHKGPKTVSSTVGHGLIDDNPYATARFAQACKNMTKLQSILKSGDLDGFINLVESEALTLHSLMMSSNPYFILMKSETLKVIEAIWAKREKDGVKWCFTLDAGANVHFLYPQADKEAAIALGYGSLYNHSSTPNAQFVNDLKESCIIIECIVKINAGQEILLNYIDDTVKDKVWFEEK